MCHMSADTLDELHEMADKIGLRREWFQISNSGLPHYDISLGKKKLALKYGAVECDQRTIVAKSKILMKELEECE